MEKFHIVAAPRLDVFLRRSQLDIDHCERNGGEGTTVGVGRSRIHTNCREKGLKGKRRAGCNHKQQCARHAICLGKQSTPFTICLD